MLRSEEYQVLRARYALDGDKGRGFLARIYESLASTSLVSLRWPPSEDLVSGAEVETVLSQICFSRYVEGRILAKQILIAHCQQRPLVVGLPKPWRQILGQQGIRVAERRSASMWGVAVALAGLRGSAKFLYQSFRILMPSEHARSRRIRERFAFMHWVSAENFPTHISGVVDTDVVTWLENHEDTLVGIDYIASSSQLETSQTRGRRKVEVYRHPISVPVSPSAVVAFLVNGISVCLRSIRDALIGRWETAILSSALIDVELLKATQGKAQAVVHFFNSSGVSTRPLWSYYGRRFGIRSICYHYTTNMEPIVMDSKSGQPIASDAWRLLSQWDEQWVWDGRQAQFLESDRNPRGSFRIVGPISFVTSRKKLPNRASGHVALFDVTPRNANFTATWVGEHLYSYSYVRDFVLMVVDVAVEHGLTVVLKTKRKIPWNVDEEYLGFCQEMEQRDNFLMLSGEHSPQQLIQESIAAISIPFTSTAHYAQQMGVNSVYFDPWSCVSSDSPSRRDVPLFGSQSELHSWFNSVSYG